VWVNVNDASKRQNVNIYPTIFSADVAGSGKATGYIIGAMQQNGVFSLQMKVV